MIGQRSGVVTRIQVAAPDAMRVHCSSHREALAAKGMPDRLKDILDNIVKMVSFIKAPRLLDCTVQIALLRL